MQLVDGLEEAFDFIAGAVEVCGGLLELFVAAVNLRLEIADRAVGVAGGARGEGLGRSERFKLGFELWGGRKIFSAWTGS